MHLYEKNRSVTVGQLIYSLHIGKPNFYDKGVAINNRFNLNGTDFSTVQRTLEKGTYGVEPMVH